MYHFVIQVSLISVVLLSTHALSSYNQREATDFSIINVERTADDGTTGQREILVFEVPRQFQVPNLFPHPHLVSLEKVQNQAIAAQKNSAYAGYPQYPSNYPQSPYVTPTPAPTWNYQTPERPYFFAVEDTRPTHPQTPSRHFSLFDVNLPALPPIIINSYPKGPRELEAHLPNPIRDNLQPDIDVRSSNSNQNVHTETPGRNIQVTVSTDGGVPATQQNDPNRPLRSAGKEDPQIVFPDEESDDTDDSVEILAPLRSPRNTEPLESNAQLGYPFYRYGYPL